MAMHASVNKNVPQVYYDKDDDAYYSLSTSPWRSEKLMMLEDVIFGHKGKTKRMGPITLFHQASVWFSTAHDIQLLWVWVSQKLF